MTIKEEIEQLEAEKDRLRQSLVGHFYDLLFSIRTRRQMQQVQLALDALYPLLED